MKTKLLAILLMTIIPAATCLGQNEVKKPKPLSQTDVLNDFSISYGIGSVYYYIDQNQNSNLSWNGIGTFMLGYTRSINRVIGVGFEVGFTPVSATNNNSYGNHYTKNYNYLQALARVKFCYLNRPAFVMYSGVAIGVTMNYYNETNSGSTTAGQSLLPAGELSLLGFRLGRSAAFTGEFGIGTLSILNIGFSYKFGQ